MSLPELKQGGHDIPVPTIRRRYRRGLANLLKLYVPLVDELQVFDASQLPPISIAELKNGQEVVADDDKWTIIKASTEHDE